MLCSHQKKFIYLKTRKTAGTSVEIFLEKFCCPPESYVELLNRHESITKDGIIGFRTDRTETLIRSGTFWHHMPAADVKQLLGKDVWDTYYKFCNVRNSFDKVVSFFWMKLTDVERDHLSSAPFDDVRRRFLTFASVPMNLPLDRKVFMIDGKPIVDDFIRYEYILTDLERVCEKLRIEFSPEKLGKYKSDTRRRPEHFSEYYEPQLEKIIRRLYAWEINHFNYQLS